jgi:hypothetical protein
MKHLAIGLCMAMIAILSQANTTQSHTKITEWSARTATKKGLAIAPSMMRIPKPKIFRSNPFRQAYFNSHWDENDDIEIDDDSKITGPRREQYGRVKANPTPADPEGDVTPDIEWRLFLIRQAALFRYRALHA